MSAARSEPASASPPRIVGAGALIALQACSRLCSVLLAQAQVRLTSAEAFGAANIHLELLLGTILTFARQGVRDALSRQAIASGGSDGTAAAAAAAEEDRQRSIRNVALLPLPVGVAIAAAVMTLYRTTLAPDALTSHAHFAAACNVFLAGALLELASEPLYIDAIRHVHLAPRVWAEGSGVLLKGAGTLATMVFLQRRSTHTFIEDLAGSLLPFGVGQLLYGASFLLVFLAESIRRNGWVYTVRLYTYGRRRQRATTFDRESLALSVSMTRQNVVKHLLGEGDKFAVAKLASLSEQGAYALASNYGSLVARLLYQPIEESARLSFATTLGSSKNGQDGSGPPPASNTQGSLDAAQSLLSSLLGVYGLLALFLVTFCPPLATPALLLVAGPRWALETSAPRILAVYGAVYLPAMACNGLLEGFLQACASPSQLALYDGVLIAASVWFVASLAIMTASGIVTAEVALVLAGSMSTWSRALYSYSFAVRYFHRGGGAQRFSLNSIVPSAKFASLAVVSAAALYRSALGVPTQAWQWPWTQSRVALNHVILASFCLTVMLLVCVTQEKRTLTGAWQAVRGRRA